MNDNRKSTPSETPDPSVEDPHPGSISDGTHPEANERKTPRGDRDALKSDDPEKK